MKPMLNMKRDLENVPSWPKRHVCGVNLAMKGVHQDQNGMERLHGQGDSPEEWRNA